jgi:hypothetical protein
VKKTPAEFDQRGFFILYRQVNQFLFTFHNSTLSQQRQSSPLPGSYIRWRSVAVAGARSMAIASAGKVRIN